MVRFGAISSSLSGTNDQVLKVNAGGTEFEFSSVSISGVSAIGNLDSQTKDSKGAQIAGTILSLQAASGTTYPGLISTGVQTIGGTKTFTSDIYGNLVGDATGNAGTVTNGVYTSTNQTIGGTKTFSSTISGSITGNAGTVSNGVYTSRTISTGDGLSGGGDLTANRTLTVDSTVVRTTGTQSIAGTKTFIDPIKVNYSTTNVISLYCNSTFEGDISSVGNLVLLSNNSYPIILHPNGASTSRWYFNQTGSFTVGNYANASIGESTNRIPYTYINNFSATTVSGSTGYFGNPTPKLRLEGNSGSSICGIVANTSDGADNHVLYLNGGGDYDWLNSNRGATLLLGGNESFIPGSVYLWAGNVAGTKINFGTGGVDRWSIDSSGKLIQDATNGGNIVLNKETVSRALYLDSSNNIKSSTVTTTELDWVHGVTSDIQTQLNGKVPTTRNLTAGDGLSGGGTLAADRSFAVDGTVVRTSTNQFIDGNKTFSGLITVGEVRAGSAAALHLGANSVNRWDIDTAGNLVIATSGAHYSIGSETYRVWGISSRELNLETATTNSTMLHVESYNTGFSSTLQFIKCDRSPHTAYHFIYTTANPIGSADNQHYLRGNGDIGIDGSYLTNASDYGEFFEVYSGIGVIPIGTTVVLDITHSGMVRSTTSGENTDLILGVVRSKPADGGSCTCGNSPLGWHSKYLKDDYGRYMTVSGERQLNPEFNEELDYIPREDREEWHVVGLVGQVPINKGQLTNPRWIKIKDISETVELWFII